MECLWCLYCYWQPDGNCYEPHPAIFYLCVFVNNGLSYYYLYGARFLEKYQEVYDGSKKKSLVLFINSIDTTSPSSYLFFCSFCIRMQFFVFMQRSHNKKYNAYSY